MVLRAIKISINNINERVNKVYCQELKRLNH